jgi:hypothetical protein
MTAFYVLDVPENTAVAKIAAEDAAVTVGRIGPYFVVDRRATGCRHAVWYSCVGGVARDSRITQHDKDALRVEPV